jgi:transposase
MEAGHRGALAGPARTLRPWQTCYERFRRWQADGTWDRLLAHAQTKSDAVGEVDWEVVVDATIVRAHQHAAGARKRGRAAT